MKRLQPVHPGEILAEEFLKPLGLDAKALAAAGAAAEPAVLDILAQRASITAPLALRLGKLFGTDPRFWMNLQAQFDLAAAEDSLGKSLESLPVLLPQI